MINLKKKRILILAGEYYPYSTPCAFRMHSFAKYLPHWDFEVVIFGVLPSKDISNGRSYFTSGAIDYGSKDVCPVYRFSQETSLIRSIQNYFGIRLFYGGHVRKFFKKAIELHRKDKFDIILSTYPGAGSSLHVAKELSLILGIPYVLDYRDVTLQYGGINIHGSRLSVKKKLKQNILALTHGLRYQRIVDYEIKHVRMADAVITVSKGLGDILKQYTTTDPYIIINGYDEDDYLSNETFEYNKFTIVYAGALHWQRTPDSFISAMLYLKNNYKKYYDSIDVKFYGVAPETLSERCPDVRRLDNISCYSRIPKHEMISRMKGAGMLLHLSHRGAKGIMTSKLTEYLGAGKPVLSVPGDGDEVDAMLCATGIGMSADDPQVIAKLIMDVMNGRICFKSGNFEFYTRRFQAEQLAKLLHKVIN